MPRGKMRGGEGQRNKELQLRRVALAPAVVPACWYVDCMGRALMSGTYRHDGLEKMEHISGLVAFV
jgi:hypothetical protein